MSTKVPLLAFMAVLVTALPVRAGDLIVEVTEIRNDRGVIRLALHNNPEEFPEGERFRGFDEPANPGSIVVPIKDVPAGRYAAALLHDENQDGGMNTNFIGLPLEGFGFSRDAPVLLSAPAFEAAAFDVPHEGTRITIRVRY